MTLNDQNTNNHLRIANSRKLSSLEISRLSFLNSRTLCITFPFLSIASLPSTTSLLSLHCSVQSIVLARRPLPWCFMIFPTEVLRERAELKLNNSKCGEVTMTVDNTKKLVPMLAEDLEETCDNCTLVVHGIPEGTREDDIMAVFHRVKRVTISKRGGSAYLKYTSRNKCEEDFLALGNVVIRGANVVVMFGHNLESEVGLDVRWDTRKKIEMNRWAPVLYFISETRRKVETNDMEDEINILSSVKEMLLYSDLSLERMRNQFKKMKGKEAIIEMKLDWLNRLVESVCRKSDLSESEVSSMKRGGLRQLVEEICMFFDKYRESEEEEVETWRKGDIQERIYLSRGLEVRTERRPDSDKGLKYVRRRMVREEQSRRRPRERSLTGRFYFNRSGSEKKINKTRSWSRSSATQPESRSWITVIPVISKVKKEMMEENLQEQVQMDMTFRGRLHYMENNNKYYFTLTSYLELKLSALGLRKDLANMEVKKFMDLFMKVGKQVEELSLQHSKLVDFLTKCGYHSGQISVRLIADLVMEWMVSGRWVGTDESCLMRFREESAEDSPTQNMDSLESGTDDEDEQSIPAVIMEMDEGFPKMALVIAFLLHNEGELDEQICKDLAKAMVGVWITYGFTYQQLCEVYQLKDEEDVKVGVLKLMLKNKIDDGLSKPKSFRFKDLINLTMIYFSNAA